MNTGKEQKQGRVMPGELQAKPTLEKAQADAADQILELKTKANADLLVASMNFATNEKLRKSDSFDARKKLVLAEYLKLIADSLEPDKRASLGEHKLRQSCRALKAATQLGVGQMLQSLRPLETLANQLVFWKANSADPKVPAFRKGQLSLLIGPNLLIDRAFQKVVDLQLKQTNMRISRGLYRSFMLLPLDELEGQSMSLVPYLRMAGKLHFHILGSLAIANTHDELGRVIDSWKFKLNDVSDEEQDILANASVVVNDLVVREPYAQYGETQPVTCGAHFAFGAQMTKYFQRKKDGLWYIPVLHESRKTAAVKTVNRVDVLDAWRKALANQFNYAYYVSTSEEKAEAGTRIYGGATTFPEDEVDAGRLGNQIIPKTQSQARVTRNRIYFYLVTQLERYIGGQVTAAEVRRTINTYLADLQAKRQIDGFQIIDCDPDAAGRSFRVKLSIRWSATATAFEIDADSATIAPPEA